MKGTALILSIGLFVFGVVAVPIKVAPSDWLEVSASVPENELLASFSAVQSGTAVGMNNVRVPNITSTQSLSGDLGK